MKSTGEKRVPREPREITNTNRHSVMTRERASSAVMSRRSAPAASALNVGFGPPGSVVSEG